MLKVEIYLNDADTPYDTFFVKNKEDIEYRIDGYKTMFGNSIKISHKVTEEPGDAEAHDNWGYD
jgi:hypothetical protein